jgi:uncharacterized protein YukE
LCLLLLPLLLRDEFAEDRYAFKRRKSMGQAAQLANAARELSAAAGKYQGASGEIDRTMGLISGIAYGLQNGKTAWTGSGSSAFTTAWQKTYGDGTNINTALSGSSDAMNSLATTINDNLPAIQKYESLSQINLDTVPGSARTRIAQEILSAQQDASTALSNISSKANSLAATLSGELSSVVGVCSAGTVAVPLSGNPTQTANYWKGFLMGVMAMSALEGENSQSASSSGDSSGNTCGPDGPQGPTSWQQILAALKQNFGTPKGLAWSVGTGVIGGAANTTNNLLTNGFSKTTFNAFIGAVLGGTFGPVTLTISQLLAPKIMNACGISDQRTNNVVTILSSIFGGVVIGGVFERYVVQPVLSGPGSSPSPTPTPTPVPTPTPTTTTTTPTPSPTPGPVPTPTH